MAAGPPRERPDRNQGEDDDRGVQGEAGGDERETERRRKAQSPAEGSVLAGTEAVALDREVPLRPGAHRAGASSISASRHSGQPSSSRRAERPAARSRWTAWWAITQNG